MKENGDGKPHAFGEEGHFRSAGEIVGPISSRSITFRGICHDLGSFTLRGTSYCNLAMRPIAVQKCWPWRFFLSRRPDTGSSPSPLAATATALTARLQ